MIEIQFHPANIRQRVRYLFLAPGRVRLLAAVAAALVLTVAAGVAVAPLAVRSLLLTTDLHAAEEQNRLQRAVLDDRLLALDAARSRLDRAEEVRAQIGLILGVDQELESGLGGFPSTPPDDVRHPRAALGLAAATEARDRAGALLALADELTAYAGQHRELTVAVPSICPLEAGSFVLTSPFGQRTSPFTGEADFHSGIDLAARTGTPVKATGGGTVEFAGRFPLKKNVRWWRYGNMVILDHGDGYRTIYAHLDEATVDTGATVERGDTIGEVGNTGWSTSPHLHYEVRVGRDGAEPEPLDPRIFILDYRWTGQETNLIASRRAPAPAYDPLPGVGGAR